VYIYIYIYLRATCTPTYCFVDNLYIHIYTRDAKREIPRAIMRARPSRIINRSRLVHSLVNTLEYYNCSTTYIYSLWHRHDLFWQYIRQYIWICARLESRISRPGIGRLQASFDYEHLLLL